jgi:acyl-CoA reductase-like NAD-dependent aldehyde dehydrogenase
MSGLRIGGKDEPASSGATYAVANPATGAMVARVADAGREDVARLESLCSGKPISDCRAEVRGAARYFRFYGAAVDHLTGQTIPVNNTGLDFTLREPIGVCALIVPWNGPIAIAAKKAAPALAAGNSVILKPAPATPLTALELAGICWAAGVPADVFSVLTGADILSRAAAGIKRVSLELGGKSPNVVFADSDIGQVAQSAIAAVFANSGQDCCARSRMIVQRPVLDQFVQTLAELAGQVRQGDPLDPQTQLGSLISAGQRDRVLGFIDRAVAGGAELVCGGQVVQRPGLEAGNAITPAVVTGADPDSEVATTEVFGPVATILPFDDEDEAIALANGTRYGLSGSLWTRDIGRAIRVSREIRSGLLSINSDSSSYIQAPFGGYGHSGLGREQGLEGLHDFTEVKNIYVSDQ